MFLVVARVPVINISHCPVRRCNTLTSKIIKTLKKIDQLTKSKSSLSNMISKLANEVSVKKHYQHKCASSRVISQDLHL